MQAMKVRASRRCANPIVLNLVTRCNSGQIQTPDTFASWKASPVPIGEEAERTLLLVWTFWGGEIIYVALAGVQTAISGLCSHKCTDLCTDCIVLARSQA
jgi:hypothetical protein